MELMRLQFFIQRLETLCSAPVPRNSRLPPDLEPGKRNILSREHTPCRVEAREDIHYGVVVGFPRKELLTEFGKF